MLIWRSFLNVWDPNGQFSGPEGCITVFGSTHVVETLLFSMFSSQNPKNPNS